MTVGVPRLPFSVDPLIAAAKRRARQRRLVVVVLAVALGGGAAGATFALRSDASPRPGAASLASCGSGVDGPSFRVFACMSGGGQPKRLLVVLAGGGSVAYPAFRVGDIAVRDGEVVAAYDLGLVRVTSRRLIPLLTSGELERALHRRRATLMDVHSLQLDVAGDIYFAASTASRAGCENYRLERTRQGTIRQLWASGMSRHNTCT